MNKELQIRLVTSVKMAGHQHAAAVFSLRSNARRIEVRNPADVGPFDIIPFTCGLDASKFSDAVTTWLKQNVLEWSQP